MENTYMVIGKLTGCNRSYVLGFTNDPFSWLKNDSNGWKKQELYFIPRRNNEYNEEFAIRGDKFLNK